MLPPSLKGKTGRRQKISNIAGYPEDLWEDLNGGKLSQHEKDKPPSEGLYYVVRFPNAWRLMARRLDLELAMGFSRDEMNHSRFWRIWGLLSLITGQWYKQLRVDRLDLSKRLRFLLYAFPRGRVTKVGETYVIYHGNDLRPFMCITKQQIEERFSIVKQCRWEFDEHEQCLIADKEEMRSLLKIKEDWPAV